MVSCSGQQPGGQGRGVHLSTGSQARLTGNLCCCLASGPGGQAVKSPLPWEPLVLWPGKRHQKPQSLARGPHRQWPGPELSLLEDEGAEKKKEIPETVE